MTEFELKKNEFHFTGLHQLSHLLNETETAFIFYAKFESDSRALTYARESFSKLA